MENYIHIKTETVLYIWNIVIFFIICLTFLTWKIIILPLVVLFSVMVCSSLQHNQKLSLNWLYTRYHIKCPPFLWLQTEHICTVCMTWFWLEHSKAVWYQVIVSQNVTNPKIEARHNYYIDTIWNSDINFHMLQYRLN